MTEEEKRAKMESIKEDIITSSMRNAKDHYRFKHNILGCVLHSMDNLYGELPLEEVIRIAKLVYKQ